MRRGRPLTSREEAAAVSRRRLVRAALRGLGAVATVTGGLVVARGTRGVPGGGPVDPSTDSVLRFYALWWAARGPALWRAAGRLDTDPQAARILLVLTFAGGLARLAAARSSGWPHPLFRALTALELVLPPVAVALLRPPRRRRPGPAPA